MISQIEFLPFPPTCTSIVKKVTTDVWETAHGLMSSGLMERHPSGRCGAEAKSTSWDSDGVFPFPRPWSWRCDNTATSNWKKWSNDLRCTKSGNVHCWSLRFWQFTLTNKTFQDVRSNNAECRYKVNLVGSLSTLPSSPYSQNSLDSELVSLEHSKITAFSAASAFGFSQIQTTTTHHRSTLAISPLERLPVTKEPQMSTSCFFQMWESMKNESTLMLALTPTWFFSTASHYSMHR